MRKFASAWEKPQIIESTPTKWQWMVQGVNNFKLGESVDIGAFTYINAHYGVEIQDGAQIGSHCSIYSESTIDNKKGKIIIKRSAKIGTHSTIMPGVTIGENAVIAAYSFVKNDIPPGTLACGVPAKIKNGKKILRG